jgi:hypothetical protein
MQEQGISIFKIPHAEATYDNGALTVRLYYPNKPEELTKRLPGNSVFGANALETLLREGYARIATPECPIKPADGGSIYLFNDNVVLVHRRQFPLGKNSVHNFYHSAPGGYTENLNATRSEEGLIATGLKETAEEQILFTRDYPHWVIVANDLKEYTLQAVKNLGLDEYFGNRLKFVDVENLPSSDILEVYDEDKNKIFTSKGKGFLDPMWDNSTSLSLMQIRKLPFSSEEIFPIDAEGMVGKDGKYIHFNRESYLIPLSELADKPFGTPLENPRVHKTAINQNTIPLFVYSPSYSEPFYGPDEKRVNHPHLFAPENHFIVCLDALGVPGFKGRRLDWQLWKEKCIRDNICMIPKEFLVE